MRTERETGVKTRSSSAKPTILYMSSVLSSLIMSMTSSTVMMPSSRPRFVDDRQRQKFVARHQARSLFLIHEDIGFDRIGDHHVGERPIRRRDDQIANRHDADEFAGVVDDVKIKESFQLAALADFVDGALRRRIGQKAP